MFFRYPHRQKPAAVRLYAALLEVVLGLDHEDVAAPQRRLLNLEELLEIISMQIPIVTVYEEIRKIMQGPAEKHAQDRVYLEQT